MLLLHIFTTLKVYENRKNRPTTEIETSISNNHASNEALEILKTAADSLDVLKTKYGIVRVAFFEI
jgi:hypothetical protein